MERKLVYNAIRTPDGKVLESWSRHDYNVYQDANGKKYMIDGGLSYHRRSNNGDEVELCVYSDEPFEKVRQFASRAGYGKPNSKDYGVFRRTTYQNMSDEYVANAIRFLKDLEQGMNALHPEGGSSVAIEIGLLEKEVEYRKEHNIIIKEN